MNITVDPYLSLLNFSVFFKQILREVNLWLVVFIRLDPLSIQIDTCHRVTVVTTHDAVRVQNWDQHKSVVQSEKFGLFPVWKKKLQDALEDQGGWRLPWVHPWRDEDHRFLFKFCWFTGNCDHPEGQAAHRATQFFSLVEDKIFRILELDACTRLFGQLGWRSSRLLGLNWRQLDVSSRTFAFFSRGRVVRLFRLGQRRHRVLLNQLFYLWGVLRLYRLLYREDIAHDLRVGVRLWKREIHSVVIIFKFHFKH